MPYIMQGLSKNRSILMEKVIGQPFCYLILLWHWKLFEPLHTRPAYTASSAETLNDWSDSCRIMWQPEKPHQLDGLVYLVVSLFCRSVLAESAESCKLCKVLQFAEAKVDRLVELYSLKPDDAQIWHDMPLLKTIAVVMWLCRVYFKSRDLWYFYIWHTVLQTQTSKGFWLCHLRPFCLTLDPYQCQAS